MHASSETEAGFKGGQKQVSLQQYKVKLGREIEYKNISERMADTVEMVWTFGWRMDGR